MVKATENVPLNANGELDVDSWYESLCQRYELSDSELIVDALRFVSCVPHRAQEFLDKGVEFANLVAALNMDATSIAAALTYRPLRTRSVKLTQIEASVSPEVAILVDAVVRMADTSLLEMSNTKMQTSESRDQVENVRRMLVSMIDDARVAVLKLAERVVALRSAKGSSEE